MKSQLRHLLALVCILTLCGGLTVPAEAINIEKRNAGQVTILPITLYMLLRNQTEKFLLSGMYKQLNE